METTLVDRFLRTHDYLRISVTDRCNLRCVYCMPAEGMEFDPPEHHLSNIEIIEVVSVLAELGVRKIRITGGEPLIRRDIVDLISGISEISQIEDIALTTNGIFLSKKVKALKEAGLKRVNISIDSLQPDRFEQITRGGGLSRVLESIDAAIENNLNPIKLNVVLLKGINEDEVLDFIRLTMERPIHVRFIEYMPIGHRDDGWRTSYLPLTYVLEQCRQAGWKVIEGSNVYGNGPAEYYRIEDAKGSFGLIHPVSDHFCSSCNRLRLTADGNIKPCLYWTDEFNVRKVLGNREALKELFYRALEVKPQNHEMARALLDEAESHIPTRRRMSQIGG